MQEVEFLESTSCICLFDKCMVNGVLKKREILKKDYIWAAVYVAGSVSMETIRMIICMM